MKRGKTGESGKLGRAEAIGVIVMLCMYVFSMLASLRADTELFLTQLFYFSLITFCLVGMILAFDKLTLECARVSKHVVAGVVASSVTMFALVNFIVLKPALLQIASLSSVLPTVGLTVDQLMFVGVSEGVIHFFIIQLLYCVKENWGLAIVGGSCILGSMHVFAVGFAPLPLLFLALMFVIFGALAMSPRWLGGKVKFSLIVSAVVHMIWNVSLITLPKATEAAIAVAVV